MAERICLHKSRRDSGWETHEVPLQLGACIAHLGAATRADPDRLPDALAHQSDARRARGGEGGRPSLEAALDAALAPVVLVANETGLGIVPENALARRFRDEAGRLNQRLAARADRVIFMVAGLPMEIK